jgi:hypothetical protein
MKKLLLLLVLLLPSPALAGVSCSVPFNLQNGTTADASQVMANYNAILSCLNSAAAAGANNDITSITGITTPILPSEGGTPVFYGATSTGSGNAQVLAATVPNSFALTTNWTVVFTAGFANTAATQFNINGTGLKNVLKVTSGGLAPLGASDIVTGQSVIATYDGTQYEINSGTTLLSRTVTEQTFTGGINTPFVGLGAQSGGGSLTVDCGLGPLQGLTNAGNFTFVNPANNGSCDIQVVNNNAAGAISFSGFTVSANTGDALDTVNGHQWFIHFERINTVSTYMIKALQ